MIREIKYTFYLIVIFLFFFICGKHYFSNKNIKNSYRTLNNIDSKINNYVNELTYLENDTNSIIVYVENEEKKKKRKYYFWDLIINDN